ncbi:accessory gene regulator B family protein [Defluviitalea saccharophila]|uniref:Accessory gene regulator B family protein n=1 Tax=Defluviitalea saccharophila TaxID=879970 RepID=A0ABZ2Y3C7_9FIRM
MIKQFAGIITSFLVHENIIRDDDYEIYQYGTEQILINLTMLLVIIIIATIVNMWAETIFFLVSMLPIRAVAGGFHASTPLKCNVLTVSVYILNIIFINFFKNHMTIYILLALLSFVMFSIFRYAPVDHKNKVLHQDEFIIVKKKSRILGMLIIGTCTGVAFAISPTNVFVISTMMGALTASVSLFIGSIIRGGEKYENSGYTS